MISFKKLNETGRLGNQMFGMASVIALALRNNDTFIFPRWKYERNFNLHGYFSDNITNIETYTEPHFHYNPIPYRPNLDVFGYLQSERYFEDFSDSVRHHLTPVNHFEFEPGLCSVHVRRTDYLKLQDYHPVQPMSYYEKAMELSGCKKFLVCSDDQAWCRNHFIGSSFEFSDATDPIVDIAMMSKRCEHNIIANSSFSWFGAWLNANPNKKVIAPKLWFGRLCNHNTTDLIPKTWMQI